MLHMVHILCVVYGTQLHAETEKQQMTLEKVSTIWSSTDAVKKHYQLNLSLNT